MIVNRSSRGITIGSLLRFMAVCGTLMIVSSMPAFAIRLIAGKKVFEITEDLSMPSDIGVSGDGRIYIVDGGNNRIRIYDSNGHALSSFGQTGDGIGEFNDPLGIDIDAAGRLYVADTGNRRIQVFNANGKYIDRIAIDAEGGRMADPTDVAVDEKGKRIYIVDNDNHRILACDLSTKDIVQSFGRQGTGKGTFCYPFMIAMDQHQYLYVVDVINTRVQVLKVDGRFVAIIGGWGVDKGEFYRPKGIAVDLNGFVFVSDSYMGVIQVFNDSGDFYAALGDSEQRGVRKFDTPTGIYIDGNRRLYVAEMFANKVSVYELP